METVTFWRWSLAAVVGAVVLLACQTSTTSADISVQSCSKTCEDSGCAGSSCLPSCRYSNSNATRDALMLKLPVYRRWKVWVCSTECRYHCMLSKDAEDAGLEQEAIGYRHNWCLARVMVDQLGILFSAYLELTLGMRALSWIPQQSSQDLYAHLAKSALRPKLELGLINEPASAVFAALNLLGTLIGFLTFLKLVHYSLPARPISRGPYYPFAGLWTIFGVLLTVYWSAQCIMRSRNLAFDKHIDATLEVILAGYALVLAILRVGDMRAETARVVVLAPTLAFLFPHLMYINLCTFDYGLNILVCLLLWTSQYLVWLTWTVVKKHPAHLQLWFMALVATATMFLRLYDFSSMWEVLDPDSLWILSAVPSSFMWWSFARSDAAYTTKLILKKRAEMLEPKKEQ